MKSWKTTVSGSLAILAVIVHVIFEIKSGVWNETAIMADATALAAGIGLLSAKDNNVTGGTKDNGLTPEK
jgi:hypothetical protein